MSPDDQLERQLQRWLADTAQPMPRELLEEIVADVPRLPQGGATGRFRPGPRWLVPGVAVAVTLVVAFATLANFAPRLGPGALPSSGTLTPTTGAAQIWDPHADFVTQGPGANPSPDRYGNADVWSYRYTISGDHDPEAAFRLGSFDPATGSWTAAGLTNLLVARHEPGIVLHPWTDGRISRSAIVAWTSPIDGEISVEGRFLKLQTPCEVPANGVTVSVDLDRSTLWSETLVTGSRPVELLVTVQRGATLSFIADARANANCDGVQLELRISTGN
jgi:hypothetical protein